jgi:hypothetical protein
LGRLIKAADSFSWVNLGRLKRRHLPGNSGPKSDIQIIAFWVRLSIRQFARFYYVAAQPLFQRMMLGLIRAHCRDQSFLVLYLYSNVQFSDGVATITLDGCVF